MGDRDVELWYPVDNNDVVDSETEVFDSLTVFPESLTALIPSELTGTYETGAYRDAPPAPGPFPLLVYGHGFGGYRQVATNHTTHVASWGFVVASVDHLERGIREQTLDAVGQGVFDADSARPDAAVDDVGDVLRLLAYIATDSTRAISGIADLDQVAVTGHSAGAWQAVEAAAAMPDAIDTWISVAGGAGEDTPPQPGVVVIAENDRVVPPPRSEQLFDEASNDVLLVSIQDAGHNSFTDSCRGIRDLGGLGVLESVLGGEQVARAEDGCVPGDLEPEAAQAILNHITVAHLAATFGDDDAARSLDEAVLADISPLARYEAR